MDHTTSDVVRDRRRVAVLRDLAILDTPAEMAYDDIARLASACCQSPIAAVNFVDDERHWTKSIVGVDGGQGTSVSADISFCAATIATDGGLLNLSDTSESNAGVLILSSRDRHSWGSTRAPRSWCRVSPSASSASLVPSRAS